MLKKHEIFCRDCAQAIASSNDQSCTNCQGHRFLSHPELSNLSIAHVDCDAFYASIEKRDNPDIALRPVIVGGGVRGVVSAACYMARMYGVRSAMPMFKAKKACPDAIVVRPNMDKYAKEGRAIREMMQALTPLVEPLSIDEAFMDLTGTERLHGHTPAQSLIKLQNNVLKNIGVTVSVGLSFNKFLAKTASDLDKPFGFAVLGRADAMEFLTDKPVDFIFGVGPAFARSLAKLGIQTIADVRSRDDSYMMKQFGESGLRLARLARAEDRRKVNPVSDRKSVSAETTFNDDISDPEALKDRLWILCVKTADRAKAKGLTGRVVTLKLKTKQFETVTRRRTLAQSVQLADAIFNALEPLLTKEANGRKFRLLGAGISDLSDASETSNDFAVDLLDPGAAKRNQAERATDAARAKFGKDAIVKGREFRVRHKPTNQGDN